MNPARSLEESKERFLQIASLQILGLAALLLVLSLTGQLERIWIAISLCMALPAILVRGLSRQKISHAAIGFLVPVGGVSLLAPWTGGGIFHPALFLALAWIQATAFLTGFGPALAAAIATAADFFLLFFAGRCGIVHEHRTEGVAFVLYISLVVLHIATFVNSPLRLVRRLVSVASADLVSRKRNELHLQALTDHLEVAVEERRQELVASQVRLRSAVDEVASEFRDPIDDLLLASELLDASFVEGTGDAAMARRIASACRRMDRIHSAFLRFCRLGEASLKIRRISAKEHEAMVMEIWSEVSHAHGERLFSFLLETLAPCEADPDLLKQVWQNLLSNAVKYTAGKDVAWIRAGHDSRGFFVEDNGVGFDMAWVDQLFGVFHRLHREGEFPGEGIGLAMAHRIMDLHKGSISAESVQGKGATFRFSLPGPVAAVSSPGA